MAKIRGDMSQGILELDQLSVESDYNELYYKNRENSFLRRNWMSIPIVIAIVALIIRSVYSDISTVHVTLLVLIILLKYLETISTGKYSIIEEGILVPYTSFTRKLISWKNIINIHEVSLEDIHGYAVELDTSLLKFNTTGMTEPSLYLTEDEFERDNLDKFINTLRSKKDAKAIVPNTLAERLDKQVDRAWNGRYRRFTINMLDGVINTMIYLVIIEILLWNIFGISLFPWIGGIVIASLLIISVIIHFDTMPNAIIGIRPNELGPLIYDESNLITSVRFMLKSYPNDVELLNCTMINPEENIKQVESLKEIQPEIIKSGELTHAVAQIRGNHSKSVGASIAFRYSDDKDTTYTIDLLW